MVIMGKVVLSIIRLKSKACPLFLSNSCFSSTDRNRDCVYLLVPKGEGALDSLAAGFAAAAVVVTIAATRRGGRILRVAFYCGIVLMMWFAVAVGTFCFQFFEEHGRATHVSGWHESTSNQR